MTNLEVTQTHHDPNTLLMHHDERTSHYTISITRIVFYIQCFTVNIQYDVNAYETDVTAASRV